MLVWRKLSSVRLEDTWPDRLACIGPERLVITHFPDSNRIKLEIFDVTSEQSKYLTQHFGGQTRDLHKSQADWARSIVQRQPISIRGRFRISNTAPLSPLHPRTLYVPAGMAFGTGEHATTSACLRMLVDVAPRHNSWSFLDVGTGTGILAFAAHRLGANPVAAFDSDPTSIQVARENARLNKISNVEFFVADALLHRAARSYDFVAANLYSHLFCCAACRVWAHISSGGHLIISGIMRDQLQTVIGAVQELKGLLLHQRTRGKWVTLLVRKPGNPG
ncbi:MAG: 50S ribosomal protein L11 methyltransferase [Verrucomicrobia bacterium]|nr:50S ribosomal protein L11 methyltransferase [Verrucomicrobiota bacterium]